jgi:hypothetical protein
METRFSWLTNVSELEGLVEGFRWAFYAGAVLTGSVRVGIAEESAPSLADLKRMERVDTGGRNTAGHRLYRATASGHSVLGHKDRRMLVRV